MQLLILALATLTAPLSGELSAGRNSFLTNASINAACVADTGGTSTPTCASFVVPTNNAKTVCLNIDYVKGAATDVRLYKDSSTTGTPPWGSLQTGDGSDLPGIQMLEHYAWWDTSGLTATHERTWDVCFDVTGPYTRFRFTSTSGNSDDKVKTAYVTLIGG